MCPLFFIKFLFSTKGWPFKNYEKCVLFHLKSYFCSRDISFFVFVSSLLFLHVSHCVRGCLKINLKVYDVINSLNKSLITSFVWYLGKEKRYDIEILSTDRVLSKKKFLWKNDAENVHQKLVPYPFLILVNNSKKPLHAVNSFENKLFWKRIIKNP